MYVGLFEKTFKIINKGSVLQLFPIWLDSCDELKHLNVIYAVVKHVLFILKMKYIP